MDNDNCIIGVRDSRTVVSDRLSSGLKEVLEDDESVVRHKFGFSRFEIRLARKLIHLLGGDSEVIMKAGSPTEFGFLFPLVFDTTNLNELTGNKKEEKIEKSETEAEDEVVVQGEKNKIEHEKEEKIEIPEPKPEPKPTAPVAQPPAPKKDIDLKSLSCLYVEDQVDSQILFKVQMKELKSVQFANSVEEAMPKLESGEFDFIVLDMNLQGEYNGLDALRIIQQMPGYENKPMIAATAYVLPGDRDKFIAAGFTDFISKPILRDKMIGVLAKVMGN